MPILKNSKKERNLNYIVYLIQTRKALKIKSLAINQNDDS